MNWYVAKIIFRIVAGDGKHHAQFDEQLRLISAETKCQAFEKAVMLGHTHQEYFMNNEKHAVKWQFVNVAEVNPINGLEDGAELYYQIHETENADQYMAWANHKAALIELNT